MYKYEFVVDVLGMMFSMYNSFTRRNYENTEAVELLYD
jgi:hypothetical protein